MTDLRKGYKVEKPGGIILWPNTVGFVAMNDGTEFYCPEILNLIRHIIMCYIDHTYDPKVVELTRDDKIIVDVGGYVGMFGIYAAKKTGAKVYIFEPLPHMAEFCRTNVETNGLESQVEVIEIALDAKKDKRTLRFWANQPEMGYFTETDGSYFLTGQIEVETARLEDCGIDKIDFLKMNCEGAEGYIIPAMSEKLLRNTKKIALQMHERLSPVSGKEIKEVLWAAGFKTQDNQPDVELHWIYAWRDK